ncbi:MAG: PIN domain-containing protein [Clostridia bacterium]|nr:PIN domain-containing protein [Clostridia bacterium]
MKIYMDCCCYNRPFDDLTQKRNRIESEAIMWILDECRAGNCEIVASAALSAEISRISNIEKRQGVLELYQLSGNFVGLNQRIKERAADIRNISNVQTFDSYHIASAEEASADVLLTTDDKLVKMTSKLNLNVQVMNPLTFMMLYMYGGDEK